MVESKLDGAVDKSSVDLQICKSDTTLGNLWRPAPSGTGLMAGWQSSRRNLGEA